MKTEELKKKIENIIGLPVQILSMYETVHTDNNFQYLHELTVRFSSINDNLEEIEIASLKLQIINSELSDDIEDDDYDMWELMDDESIELAEVAEDLGLLNWGVDFEDTNLNILDESHLYYIEQFEVMEDYQGKGIGSAIMKTIFDLIKKSTNLVSNYIVFIPFAFRASEENVLRDCNRLYKFYSKFGAKLANDSGRTWVLEREE